MLDCAVYGEVGRGCCFVEQRMRVRRGVGRLIEYCPWSSRPGFSLSKRLFAILYQKEILPKSFTASTRSSEVDDKSIRKKCPIETRRTLSPLPTYLPLNVFPIATYLKST